ncbi:hypothetical protein CEXT_297341 [Caerostris extrusa]|uniref:Uncharacterized protein n=1 Tax=Caerostris extrusa TaxID=172846 RepID=A0AAV4MG67_CAEEX|nr:hypothetical protein CEXT_297341 [Caerostris extrusa]
MKKNERHGPHREGCMVCIAHQDARSLRNYESVPLNEFYWSFLFSIDTDTTDRGPKFLQHECREGENTVSKSDSLANVSLIRDIRDDLEGKVLWSVLFRVELVPIKMQPCTPFLLSRIDCPCFTRM